MIPSTKVYYKSFLYFDLVKHCIAFHIVFFDSKPQCKNLTSSYTHLESKEMCVNLMIVDLHMGQNLMFEWI